ncbi:MAG: DUF72 domain-containing protein, partial [Bacteroidota bacterium]
MKFGKLPDIQGIDFLLPPDPPRTTRVLAEKPLESSKSAKIFLGATGWGNKEWVGKWYPPKTPARDFLKHYSRQFNTIEFNPPPKLLTASLPLRVLPKTTTPILTATTSPIPCSSGQLCALVSPAHVVIPR